MMKAAGKPDMKPTLPFNDENYQGDDLEIIHHLDDET